MEENKQVLLPLGAIRQIQFKKNQILLVPFGNLLEEILLPFDAYKIESENPKKKFRDAIEISKKDLNSIPKLKILEVYSKNKYKILFYETMEPLMSLSPSLLYVEEKYIANSSELYFYHLKDQKAFDNQNIYLGKVKDYLETSAHGILIIQLEEYNQKEIFVPFIDTYCKIEFKETKPKKIDKIIVYDWKYFLET
ncbi:MAG: hypothetical protein ACK4UJ_08505 [Leptonema sp. (in: bacteria)]